MKVQVHSFIEPQLEYNQDQGISGEACYRTHVSTHAKSFRSMIICIPKSNFLQHVFTIPIFMLTLHIWLSLINQIKGALINILILRAIDSTQKSKRFSSQSS